jgi:pimeloyl-ACP methyl ester carboxylesterase
VKPRTEQIRAEGTGPMLHTLQWGDASAVRLILLHGGGANANWWRHIAPAFADRFHVVALDFRGHGDSERPQELVVGAFNDDLEALLEHLNTSENARLGDSRAAAPATILIGHSMGAHVAFDHAARENVHAMVLIDPSRGGEKRRGRRLRLALSFRRSYSSSGEAIERYRFLPDAEHVSEALRRSIASYSVEQEADGRWGYKFDSRWFGLPSRPRPNAADVECPTLIIRGAESDILSEEGARELCSELPRGQLDVVEDAGHHVQIDRPEAVVALLESFLREVAP